MFHDHMHLALAVPTAAAKSMCVVGINEHDADGKHVAEVDTIAVSDSDGSGGREMAIRR